MKHVDLGDRRHRRRSLLAGCQLVDEPNHLVDELPHAVEIVALVGDAARQGGGRPALTADAGGQRERAFGVPPGLVVGADEPGRASHR